MPLTFVPPFPTYPPETSWMRQPTTDIPGLVLSEHGAAASRICRPTSTGATRANTCRTTRG